MIKLRTHFAAAFTILLAAPTLIFAQQKPVDYPVYGPVEINFTELAQYEATHPVAIVAHEKGEKNQVAPANQFSPIPANAVVTKMDLPKNNFPGAPPTPTPVVNFTGMTDDGYIPPDVQAAAGPTYLDEAINLQYRISNKTGGTISTISDNTFWSALSSLGTPASDPRIQYDPNNQRWITCVISSKSSYGLFIGVSKTSDPTGSWYLYQFSAGSGSNLPDFPSLGFNANWAVVTDDYFANGATWNKEQVWVMNIQDLYNGTLGTVHEFDDAAHIGVLCPAQTYDAAQTTEYLLQDYSGNSGGNGFVRMTNITGTPDAPVYNTGTTIGINQPWSETVKDPFQKGSTHTINSDDSRMSGVLYRNGYLWGAHSVYLPASVPTHCSSDIWQINTSTNTVNQFFRIDDPTNNTNYFYATVSVNANDDALIGYTLSGNNDYPSASYNFRAGTDALNTLEGNFTYKAGLASYYKTFGTGRNRWGDYSATMVDPTDQSFWTCQEWAQTGNNWATQYANIPAASGTSCQTPGGLTASAITTSSATLSWNVVTGAVGYNIQYRVVGSGTWNPLSSSTNSYPLTGLSSGTTYEYQVQTDCGGGNLSSFSASFQFTTTSTSCTDNYEPNNTKQTAAPIPANTAIQGLINPAGDIDWFSFSNTASQPNIEVNLTNLPADYNITLYNPSGTQIGVSKNTGTANEQIKFNTSTVGTYKVKINGKNNAFNATQCYTLEANISSSPFRLSSSEIASANGISAIYPNPVSSVMNIEYSSVADGNVVLVIHDLAGKSIQQVPITVTSGTNVLQMQVNHLTAGIYMLEVKSSSGSVFHNFVLQQ